MSTFPIGGKIGKIGEKVEVELAMMNRHGLISGATWTGKTITLQVLAEQLSKAGVSIFAADVKGDLSGISKPWVMNPKIEERIQSIGLENYSNHGYPTVFWDIFWKRGHPLRTTVSEMGPILLSHLMNVSDVQESLLHIAFKIADDKGWLLLNLDDLKTLLAWMSEHKSEIQTEYGNIADSSIGSIQRSILVLSEAGGDMFFWEPAFDINMLFKKDYSGNGVINILDAKVLMQDTRMYSTFLLWLLSELFEQLPEVGDIEKPKLVFFFDEAHLLFRDAPKALVEKVEQVVRLIRSKGVGIFFITQNPLDIPDVIRSQLGNRVIHSLRAFTEEDKKGVKAAAETFRENPEFDTVEAITNLGVGEWLVSTLDLKWIPKIVEKVMICPPEARMGAITDEERTQSIQSSPVYGIYETMIDRESAEEKIKALTSEEQGQQETFANHSSWQGSLMNGFGWFMKDVLFWNNRRQWVVESIAKDVLKQAGRKIVRGALGGILK
jgi:uncharacterized protein